MSSPLNPNARKVGKVSKTQATQAVTSGIAAASRRRDGLAEVEIDGKKVTINDTDAIAEQVQRVLRELGQ